MGPTKKQINFIEQMCLVLDIDIPKCKTIGEASTWIDEHLATYNLAMKIRWIDTWDLDDYASHGMDPYDYYS